MSWNMRTVILEATILRLWEGSAKRNLVTFIENARLVLANLFTVNLQKIEGQQGPYITKVKAYECSVAGYVEYHNGRTTAVLSIPSNNAMLITYISCVR
jgi:hypothetical protein